MDNVQLGTDRPWEDTSTELISTPPLVSPEDANPEDVIAIALNKFAELGFNDTKMEAIANESGMSKRMIHYHFGDKRGLYRRCLELAVHQLRPSQKEIESDSPIVIDGVQKVVEAMFNSYITNANAVRLLLMENLHNWGEMSEGSFLNDKSPIMLQLNKLLIRGQDLGAFRPGISAHDVFTLIASLAVFRISNQATTQLLYGIDTTDEANTQGMTRLAIDAVLAFLTSNLAERTEVSYLTESTPAGSENLQDDDDSSYDITADLFE